jgi:hypothetical protein
MRLLDEQYLRTPFYGIRRMTAWLQELNYGVCYRHFYPGVAEAKPGDWEGNR